MTKIEPACRSALLNLSMNSMLRKPNSSISNPRLALASYLSVLGDEHKAETELLDIVERSTASPLYCVAFKRWKQLQQQEAKAGHALIFTATVQQAFAIGLGEGSSLEMGFTLHPSYGMPTIPGQALKGTARRVLPLDPEDGQIQQWQEVFFGTTNAASHFVFHSAWFDPDSVGGKPFKRDGITPHHPLYQRNPKTEWPTDFDDPTPIPHLIVKQEAKFFFAIGIPNSEWGQALLPILKSALTERGLGAKTNSGFGRFQINDVELNSISTFLPETKNEVPVATVSPQSGLPLPLEAEPETDVRESQVWEKVTVRHEKLPGNRWQIRIRRDEETLIVLSQGDWNRLPLGILPPKPGISRQANVSIIPVAEAGWKVTGILYLKT
jgi:CRISPR type III-B/RAMP module RAMP protein Cmr6